VKIWTANHGYHLRDKLIYEQAQVKKPVHIGNDVWIGSNVFISPGVEVPNGCVVAAGSVVNSKHYKPYSILAGNPARVIGFRR
ncbi:MAG TPA: acyltransferase, partial [Deltaproteobacteria bacterium]|nr:acyltransferase [Deltaproteobacteria bacterium]